MTALIDYVHKLDADRWLILGAVAQVLFAGRMAVQWLQSERQKRSVVPIAFWWLSIGGGSLLFIYALGRHDPVFILGQGLPLGIYVRNIWLIYARRARAAADPAIQEARQLVERLAADLARPATLVDRSTDIDHSAEALIRLLAANPAQGPVPQ